WPAMMSRARRSRKSLDGSCPEPAASCSMRYCAWTRPPTSMEPFSLKEIFAALAVLATSKDIAQSNGLQRFQVMRETSPRAAEERTPREPPGPDRPGRQEQSADRGDPRISSRGLHPDAQQSRYVL